MELRKYHHTKSFYSLSTSATSIDEETNSSVRTTISTTGVDSGTRLYYTLQVQELTPLISPLEI